MNALFIIAAAALSVLIFNLMYSRFWDYGLETEISFSGSPAVEGDQRFLTEIIVNQKLLLLPALRVKFQIDRNLAFENEENTSVSDKSYRHDIFSVMSYQKITRRLPFTCKRRGYYTIDQLDLLTYDLFLSGHLVKQLPVNTCLYVYPAPADPVKLSIPLRCLMGELLSLRYAYEDPFEFQGIREYQPFDTLSAVNWKATARTGQLKVNVHGHTSSQEVVLLLNLESETIWEYDMLREISIRIAGSLGNELISQGIPAGLFSNCLDVLTGQPSHLLPGCTPAHAAALMEALSRIQTNKGMASFHSLLTKLTATQRQGNANRIYVIISTSQRSDNEKALAGLLSTGNGGHSASNGTGGGQSSNALFLCPLHPDMDFHPPRLPGLYAYRWEVSYDQK